MDPAQFSAQLAAVQDRIHRAAQRSGRSLADVTVVAVTKTVGVPNIQQAWACGVRDVGESRVQETEQKRSILAGSHPNCSDLKWHLIGHLQSNKAKKAIELFDSFQSLDSLPLAEVLNREGEKRGKVVPCLAEVKVSQEPTKFGIPPDELSDFLNRVQDLSFIRVEGLMTIAPYFDEAEAARPFFRRTRQLFDKFVKKFKSGRPLLSMGMSHDFEIAVEEGSNMIRVGTALFGERPAVTA